MELRPIMRVFNVQFSEFKALLSIFASGGVIESALITSWLHALKSTPVTLFDLKER